MKNYGEPGEAIPVCPGEESCERFNASSGKTHELHVKNACHPCPLFSTKLDAGKKSHEALQRLAHSALRLRREQLAGYPRDKATMRHLAFETLLMVEQIIEQEEIAMRKQANAMLMTGFGIKFGD